jgi:tetratricopeptide (TPR) repeat protein
LEAAWHPDILGHYGNYRWLASLEAASNAHDFEVAVLRAIGLDPAVAGFEAAIARLAERPSLLILDNLETPWEGDRVEVESRLARLAQIPGITLLASFRGVDAVLGVEWTIEREVNALKDTVAKTLFLGIATEISPNDSHLDLLLNELGGVPLAIILVAARARPFSTLFDIWAEWKASGVELARRTGVNLSRLNSVPHSIEFSLRSPRISSPGHRLFRLLGVLPAGLSSSDRVELMEHEHFEAASELLATRLAFERAGRLMMLPPIRDYARRFCPPAQIEAVTWCSHYLSLATEFGSWLWTSKGGRAIDRLVPEWPNVEAALCVAPERHMTDRATDSLLGVSRLLATTGIGSPESIEALAREAESVDEKQGAAQCMWSLGDIALYRSDNDKARHQYERAMTLFERTGNAPGSVLGLARCERGLAEIALRTTNFPLAVKGLKKALSRFRLVNDSFGEAYCLEGLAEIALRRGEFDHAEKLFAEAKSIYGAADIMLGVANAMRGLAEVALRRKNYRVADEVFSKARQLYKEIRVELGEANCALYQADVALERFDSEDGASREILLLAERTYADMLSMFRRVADKLGQGNCFYGMGEVQRRLGNFDAARGRYREALALYQSIQELISIGWAYCRLAQISSGNERKTHKEAARETWQAANITNLIAELDALE